MPLRCACSDHLGGHVRPVAGVGDLAVLREAVHRREGGGAEGLDRPDRVAAEVVDVEAAQPRRRAGLTGLQEVVVGQRDQRQPRLDLAHPAQRAPVEALDGDLLEQAGRPDLARGDLDELLARRGLARRAGLDLGLDVELHVVGAVALDQREDLAQQRHPGARHGELSGQVGQRPAAAVEGAHLGQGQRVDVLADVRELGVACGGRAGVGALRAAHPAVVGDHRLAVLGDLHVQFQRADTRAAARCRTRRGCSPPAGRVRPGGPGGRSRADAPAASGLRRTRRRAARRVR